jgi:hypothetical protein
LADRRITGGRRRGHDGGVAATDGDGSLARPAAPNAAT